jgi:hypothetical protein
MKFLNIISKFIDFSVQIHHQNCFFCKYFLPSDVPLHRPVKTSIGAISLSESLVCLLSPH